MTRTQEAVFRRFLKDVRWHGRPLTEAGITNRVARVKKAEELLNKGIDTIVYSTANMREALTALRQNDVRGNRANAVRKYYEMKNGAVFPRMREAVSQVDSSDFILEMMEATEKTDGNLAD